MVDVHAAQWPPAPVRVVVVGVGLHTAGVVVHGTAGERTVARWALPAGPEAHRAWRRSLSAAVNLPSPTAILYEPRIPVFSGVQHGKVPVGPRVPFPAGAGQGAAGWRTEDTASGGPCGKRPPLGHLRSSDADGFAWRSASAGDTALADRPRKPRGPRQCAGREGHSPGHLHEGEGHGGGIDGQVPIQVDDDAEIEQVDPH